MVAALDHEAVENGMMYNVADYKDQFDQLKENKIICNALKFMAVVMVISFAGMYTPWAYSIIPDKLSEVCMCSYWKPNVKGIQKFLWISSPTTF